MNIQYHKTTNILEIKDGAKVQLYVIIFFVICSMLSTSAWLLKSNGNFGFEEILLATNIMVSVVVLYFVIFKLSFKEKIAVQTIEKLTVKTVSNTKRYTLQLKNGKSEPIRNIKNAVQARQLEELLSDLDLMN